MLNLTEVYIGESDQPLDGIRIEVEGEGTRIGVRPLAWSLQEFAASYLGEAPPPLKFWGVGSTKAEARKQAEAVLAFPGHSGGEVFDLQQRDNGVKYEVIEPGREYTLWSRGF